MQKENILKRGPRKKEIIAHIVDLMKDELSYSEIRSRIVKEFHLTEEEADEYVKIAFETVSFLEKGRAISREERLKVVIAGLLLSLISGCLYAYSTLRSHYNLQFTIVLYSYLISVFLYHLARRKSDLFLFFFSGLCTLLFYLIGELIIYHSLLKREIALRGIEIRGGVSFISVASYNFFSRYLLKKDLPELIIVICSVFLSMSFFIRRGIKRIRE